MLADMWTDHLPVLQKELSELTAKCERYIGTEGGGMDQAISLMAHHGMVSRQSCILQCNTVITSLPSVSAVALGMFCGCLLYTSPSPRDYETSRMPSSA